MREKNKKIIGVMGILGMILCGISTGRPIYAAQGMPPATEAPSAWDAVFTYGEDGVVDGKKEFTIPAAAGENLDIEITFSGNGADGVLSFAYDRVTEDQMVPNVDSSADDRSGLLNEAVKEGQQQTRSFSVAAIEGDIVITATGQGKVVSIKAIKQAAKAPNEKACIYTVGDSLVQTYAAKYAPQTGWGQTLPLYFDENVTFANRALGGRSTGNYMRQGRLNQVLCEIAPGDCVLIEFGHNDSSSGNKDRYVSVADYKKLLAEVYIKGIRDRGATPVLVTLCNRNQYLRTTSEFTVSYPEYVEAMRETAQETDTLLIDLNAITVDYFTKLNLEFGPGITKDIIYNHAIAGAYEGEYAKGVRDDTHLQYYGARLVAGFVAEELQKLDIEGISEHYAPLETPEIPKVPEGIAEKKYGNFVSRITWDPCEGADYYKVEVAELARENAQEGGTGGETLTDGTSGNSPGGTDGAAPDIYELAGEFEIAGYTTVCDFANMDAVEGKHYAYKVTAVNAAGESPESEVFSIGLQIASGEKTGESQLLDGQPSSGNREPSASQPGASGSSGQQPEASGSSGQQPEGSASSVQQPKQAQPFKIVIIISVVLAVAAVVVLAAALVRKKGRK